MAKCVCCGCVLDDDCCVDGYFFTGGGSSGCPAGQNGPYATGAECNQAVLDCWAGFPFPIPRCVCANIDNECCDDNVCRSTCEELPP